MWKNIKITLILIIITQIFASAVAVENKTNSYDEMLTSTEIASSPENIVQTTIDDVSVSESNNEHTEFPFLINSSMYDDIIYTAETAVTETALETTRKWIPVEAANNGTTLSLNGSKLNETQHKAIEKIKEGPNSNCSHYSRISLDFDFDKMVDVWQTVYYQMPDRVHCFKIYVKKLLEKDKQYNKNTYGDFKGKVDWNKCNLEIKAATKLDRRHVLQGDNHDGGVMNNIIIEECRNQGKCDQPSDLKEEASDQWFVKKNLLIMRDCDTGGILVFSRVPFQPTHEDIEEVMSAFGEKSINGRMACEDNEINIRFIDEEEGVETVTDF